MNYIRAYADADSFTDNENKSKVLLKVLQGLLAALDSAKIAIEKKDYERKYRELAKIKMVLEALDGSLDLSYGDIPMNLSSLYRYIIGRVQEVNISIDVKVLLECKELLKSIYEGFSSAYEVEKHKGVTKPTSHGLGSNAMI